MTGYNRTISVKIKKILKYYEQHFKKMLKKHKVKFKDFRRTLRNFYKEISVKFRVDCDQIVRNFRKFFEEFYKNREGFWKNYENSRKFLRKFRIYGKILKKRRPNFEDIILGQILLKNCYKVKKIFKINKNFEKFQMLFNIFLKL